MKKLIFALLVIVTLNMLAGLLCMSQSVMIESRRLDGAYRFVSETTSLIEPERKTTNRKQPEWDGLAFFTNGSFNISLMNKARSDVWVSSFPKNFSDLGFDSIGGSYDLKDTILTLKADIALHPMNYGRPTNFDCALKGDILTLTEKLRPHAESLALGERVIIFQKIASNR